MYLFDYSHSQVFHTYISMQDTVQTFGTEKIQNSWIDPIKQAELSLGRDSYTTNTTWSRCEGYPCEIIWISESLSKQNLLQAKLRAKKFGDKIWFLYFFFFKNDSWLKFFFESNEILGPKIFIQEKCWF